jgi:alpha-tubulin suppressor-like RCC1 family protein
MKRNIYIISFFVMIFLSSCNWIFPLRENYKEYTLEDTNSIRVNVVMPSGSSVDYNQLQILSGTGITTNVINGDSSLASASTNPVLAIVQSKEGESALIGVIDPNNSQNSISVHSTAITLMLFGLNLYTENSKDFSSFDNLFSNNKKLVELENLLAIKISSDPWCLSRTPLDNELQISIKAALESCSIDFDSYKSKKLELDTNKAITTITPQSKSGLDFRVEDGKIIVTNNKLRYVNAYIAGSNISSKTTLITPCKPPIFLLKPTETILSPSPLPSPDQGETYTYKVRVTGGSDKSNGLYNPAIDEENFRSALMFSGIHNFAFPLLNIVFGLSIDPSSFPNIVFSFYRQYEPVLDKFANRIINGINNNDLNMGIIACQLAGDLLSAFVSKPEELINIVLTPLLQNLAKEIVLNVLKNATAVFKVVSIANNVSKMVISFLAITGTPMVDEFNLKIEEPLISKIINISAGSNFSTFLKDDGALWGMGSNVYGQLGKISESYEKVPVKISDNVKIVFSQMSFHTLFIKNDNSLWGSGNNRFGQLGDGTKVNKTTPIKIMDDVKSMTAQEAHTIILKNDNSLWAVGWNSYGQLGDGTKTDKTIPVKIAESSIYVSAGSMHSMFIKQDNSLWGMGYNYDGELGIGTKTSKVTPVKVLDNIKKVSCGGNHTLILKDDNSVWATGLNSYGQLGNGNTVTQLSPVKIMDNVKNICAGYLHSLVITNDNVLYAFGYNTSGQLGDGTTTNRMLPVKIMDDVIDVTAGVYHTMILKKDATLWATGSNSSGEFGNGTTVNSKVPIQLIH